MSKIVILYKEKKVEYLSHTQDIMINIYLDFVQDNQSIKKCQVELSHLCSVIEIKNGPKYA